MERVFVAEGNLDMASVKRNLAVFDELAKADQSVVVDLQRVSRIDAAGLGALVSLKRRLSESGHDMRIINTNGQPSELMNKLGVTGILIRHRH